LWLSSNFSPPVGDDDDIVNFPRLLELNLPVPLPISRSKCYLLPCLTTLHHYGRLPLQLGQHVNELCPNLRNFQIAMRAPYGDADREKSELNALLEFFRRCSLPLTTVKLLCFKHDCAEGRAVFEHLARRPMLADLDMAWSDIAGGNAFLHSVQEVATVVTGSSRQPLRARGGGAEEKVAVPFRYLRRLGTRILSQQMKAFLRTAPSLTNLRIIVPGSECAAMFAALPTLLSALTELSITFAATAVVLTDNDLYAMQQLRSLRSLSISGAVLTPATALTDSGFGAMTECLPDLQYLKIDLGLSSLGLTGAALRFVGEHCRRLESLAMRGTWDLSCWRDTRQMPLFPRLISLWLDDAIMKPAAVSDE
jgi:hypothetical protein